MFVGMNIDEVKNLSHQLVNGSHQLRDLVNTLNHQIQSVHWVGQDREAFVHDWHSSYMPNLNNVINALEHASQRAMSNVHQQEEASNRS